jgi:hypothetical protein
VGEPARDHDGVDATQVGVVVPQDLGGGAERLHCFDDVELAVRAGELDDADRRGHVSYSR